ncbi:MAG TPA: hypothetical protein PLH57_08270, partial [Oligoflexia bacterium]|nr:hypothetical protein [Oligoflexia bacterium]
MKKQVRFGLGVLGILMLVSCTRSTAYRDDQDYYRRDGGSATSRASKFGQPKKKIFFYSFHNDTPFLADGLGDFMVSELKREVRTSGKGVVPDDLRPKETSKDFYSGDKIRLSPLIREAKRMGVAMVAVGKIKKIIYRRKGDEVGLFRKKLSVAAVDLEMRVFSVGDNKELLFVEKSVDAESSEVDFVEDEAEDPKSQRVELIKMALRNGAHQFGTDINLMLDKISWEGRIAKIGGGKIYINAGRASGILVGDILKVLTPGEDVYDPATNAYLGRSQ